MGEDHGSSIQLEVLSKTKKDSGQSFLEMPQRSDIVYS